MSRTLPFRPSHEHLRKEARRLHGTCLDGDQHSTQLLRRQLPRLAGQPDAGDWFSSITLQEAAAGFAVEYEYSPRTAAGLVYRRALSAGQVIVLSGNILYGHQVYGAYCRDLTPAIVPYD